MREAIFLTLDEVLAIHADQIRRYGGARGTRDLSLLSSAMAMPETTFDGEYLHGNDYHPVVDENQRTALMTALVFLGLNGQRLEVEPDLLSELVDGVAAGGVDKSRVAVFFRDHCVER